MYENAEECYRARTTRIPGKNHTYPGRPRGQGPVQQDGRNPVVESATHRREMRDPCHLGHGVKRGTWLGNIWLRRWVHGHVTSHMHWNEGWFDICMGTTHADMLRLGFRVHLSVWCSAVHLLSPECCAWAANILYLISRGVTQVRKRIRKSSQK